MRHVCAACRQMGCEALRSKALVNAPKSSNFGRSRDIYSTRVPAVAQLPRHALALRQWLEPLRLQLPKRL